MKVTKDTLVVTFSGAAAVGVLVLVVQASIVVGRKEKQLEANGNAIEELTGIAAELTKTTIELTKTVEFGAETTRDMRNELRGLEARLRQVETSRAREMP